MVPCGLGSKGWTTPSCVLEFLNGLVGHLDPGSISADGEAQKLAVFGSVYGALVDVHCEPQCVSQVARYVSHDPLTRALAFDKDIAVISVAGKAVTPLLQLLIQFIQNDVG